MNRKQKICILAGLVCVELALETTLYILKKDLRNENTLSYSNASNSLEYLLDYNYKITVIMADVSYENGSMIHKVPEEYILVGSIGYKVERLISSGYTYPALKITDENGLVRYIAPKGGILTGSMVAVPPVYELVTGDEALDVVNSFINENSLKLSK